jgi:hypothetical protein
MVAVSRATNFLKIDKHKTRHGTPGAAWPDVTKPSSPLEIKKLEAGITRQRDPFATRSDNTASTD